MTAKQILYDILHAFCMDTQNTNKVIKLTGIKGRIYNGKRDYWAIRKLIIRAITEQKAQEIINNMPFPFIEHWTPTEDKHKAWMDELFPSLDEHETFEFYSKNVLCPIPMIAGQRMENTRGYSITIIKQ